MDAELGSWHVPLGLPVHLWLPSVIALLGSALPQSLQPPLLGPPVLDTIQSFQLRDWVDAAFSG